MGMLAWVIMGLALWHFTIWLPDRYWGGIVGAFVGALVGAVLCGLIIHGFGIPGRHATHLSTALEPFDSLTRPLRSLLGSSSLRDLTEIDDQLRDAVEAIHRAADSMERHVEVVETLASSVPALTESVNALVKELNGLLGVLAPVTAVEHELSRVERLFGRRRRVEPRPAPPAEPPANA
jgi:hypothetical protein